MDYTKGIWPLIRLGSYTVAVAAILLAGVVGATAIAQSGIGEVNSHSSSVDTRTVVLALVAALSGTIGFYARSVEKKVDDLQRSKMDGEMCKMLMAQHQRVADSTIEQLRAFSQSAAQNDQRINNIELSILKQHPTRSELASIIGHAVDPIRLQLNNLQSEIAKLTKGSRP